MKFFSLIMLMGLTGFCSWPEGQFRPLFKGSLMRGASSIHASLNYEEYFMLYTAMSRPIAEGDLGYGLGVDWVGPKGVLKGVYRGEKHGEKLQHFEYSNYEMSYSNSLGFLQLAHRLGVGIEDEIWCDYNDCNSNKTYRLSGAWVVNPQIEFVLREQLGYRSSRSMGAHLGRKQASFEIEYHYFEEGSKWVYRQLWELGKSRSSFYLIGSEFSSNPFLWSVWGEVQLEYLFFKPMLLGSKNLGKQFEIDIGVFF